MSIVYLCMLFFLSNSGDKDDCNKTIEVMKRAKTPSNNAEQYAIQYFSPFAFTDHLSHLMRRSRTKTHEEYIDGFESEKDGSGDKDDESPLVLASNENRSMDNATSPSPISPTATKDVSPHPATGLTNHIFAHLNRCFVCFMF